MNQPTLVGGMTRTWNMKIGVVIEGIGETEVIEEVIEGTEVDKEEVEVVEDKDTEIEEIGMKSLSI